MYYSNVLPKRTFFPMMYGWDRRALPSPGATKLSWLPSPLLGADLPPHGTPRPAAGVLTPSCHRGHLLSHWGLLITDGHLMQRQLRLGLRSVF